jgi:hypothetical protein
MPRQPCSRETAYEELAKTLRWKIEHLDPSGDWEVPWPELSEHKRDFFRLCVKAVLRDRALVLAALKKSVASLERQQ